MTAETIVVVTDWQWSVGEHDEGQWFINQPDGRTGPYPSEQDAREKITVYLCVDCLDHFGLDNCCTDDCDLSLSHGGLCHPDGPETDEHCSRCGGHGFVSQVTAGDL